MKRATRALLLELRAIIAGEVPRGIHVGLNSGGGDRKERTYGQRLGLPFNPAFKRYIGHPDGWGRSRLGTASILEVDGWCRARHPGHDRGDRRPLCAKLLFDTAYWGQELADPRLEPILAAALRHAAEWRRGEQRPRLEEPLPNAPLRRVDKGGRLLRDGHRRRADKGIRVA